MRACVYLYLYACSITFFLPSSLSIPLSLSLPHFFSFSNTVLSSRAIIISGGGNSVYNLTALPYDPDIFKLDIPILGICYGHQLINTAYGGKVGQNGLREDGQFDVTVDTSCSLFAGLSKRQTVLLTHGDSIMKVQVCVNFVQYLINSLSPFLHPSLSLSLSPSLSPFLPPTFLPSSLSHLCRLERACQPLGGLVI